VQAFIEGMQWNHSLEWGLVASSVLTILEEFVKEIYEHRAVIFDPPSTDRRVWIERCGKRLLRKTQDLIPQLLKTTLSVSVGVWITSALVNPSYVGPAFASFMTGGSSLAFVSGVGTSALGAFIVSRSAASLWRWRGKMKEK